MHGVTVNSFAEYNSATNRARAMGQTLVHVDRLGDEEFPKYLSFEEQSVVDAPKEAQEARRDALMSRPIASFTTVGELMDALHEAGM